MFTTPVNTNPVVVASWSPSKNLDGVVAGTTVTATFDRAIQAATLAMSLKQGATTITSTVAYDANTRTATLTPSAALVVGTTYTASVSATSAEGTPMAAPFTWSFTTETSIGSTPATIWNSAAVPATASASDVAC